MGRDDIFFSSKSIDLAETDTYLEMTNRICYYDEPNANGAMLPSEGAESKAKSLVDQPVVAKYRVNSEGEPTFGSHEAYLDEDGNLQFATDNIGTHTKVYIDDDIVSINGVEKTLPCLFAKCRIWKRNQNVVSAAKRLYELGKLYSSWEIQPKAYEFKNGIKKITDYVFYSNCLLGYEYASPAYGDTAKAISLSSEAPELMIAEALAQDIISSHEKKEDGVKKTKDTKLDNTTTEPDVSQAGDVAEAGATEGAPAEPTVDVSALTEYDLRQKIEKACRDKLGDHCWIALHFPLDKTVWVEDYNRTSELDYLLFTYEAGEDDTITVSEPTSVKLTVSVAQINEAIAEKDAALLKANEKIQELESEVSALSPYKAAHEAAEAEKAKQEFESKKAALIEKACKSKLITEEEISDSEEFSTLIENLDEDALNKIIVERFMASLKAEDKSEIETSDTKTRDTLTPKANLEGGDGKTISLVKAYLQL